MLRSDVLTLWPRWNGLLAYLWTESSCWWLPPGDRWWGSRALPSSGVLPAHLRWPCAAAVLWSDVNPSVKVLASRAKDMLDYMSLPARLPERILPQPAGFDKREAVIERACQANHFPCA